MSELKCFGVAPTSLLPGVVNGCEPQMEYAVPMGVDRCDPVCISICGGWTGSLNVGPIGMLWYLVSDWWSVDCCPYGVQANAWRHGRRKGRGSPSNRHVCRSGQVGTVMHASGRPLQLWLSRTLAGGLTATHRAHGRSAIMNQPAVSKYTLSPVNTLGYLDI